jgi:hypothetical protein
MFIAVPWLEGQGRGGCVHYVTSTYPDRTPPLNNRLHEPHAAFVHCAKPQGFSSFLSVFIVLSIM